MNKLSTIVIAVLLCAQATAVLGAEAVRREGNEQAAMIARMQQEIRAITAERDALNAEKAGLAKEKAALAKKLDQAEKKFANTQNSLERFRESDAALRDRLTEDRARTQELVEKFRETAQNLRQVELERAELAATSSRRHEELRQCVQNNIALYQANLDLLDEYENKGVWASMMQREPALGLKRVEIENRIEEHRGRLDQLLVSGGDLR
jgi:chromosome segregation ATPase